MAEKTKKGSVTQKTVHRDPVCGMEVTESTAAATAKVGDRTYYFCSVACKQQFRLGIVPSTEGLGAPGQVPPHDVHGMAPRDRL